MELRQQPRPPTPPLPPLPLSLPPSLPRLPPPPHLPQRFVGSLVGGEGTLAEGASLTLLLSKTPPPSPPRLSLPMSLSLEAWRAAARGRARWR